MADVKIARFPEGINARVECADLLGEAEALLTAAFLLTMEDADDALPAVERLLPAAADRVARARRMAEARRRAQAA